MTRYLVLLTFALVPACSGVHIPDVDAASPPGDSGLLCPGPPMILREYDQSAERMHCPPAPHCIACPVLINSGFDCVSLARALEPCPDGGV